jgi:hypothetical protein
MSILKSVLIMVAAAVLDSSLCRANPTDTPSDELTAIYAETFHGYTRTTQADGSLSPETYGVAVGGLINSDPKADEQGFSIRTFDPSVDRTTFVEIAGVVEQALAFKRYTPTSDPKTAKLLIVVFWGRTTGTNRFTGSEGFLGNKDGTGRDLVNRRNAALLGFGREMYLFDAGFDDSTSIMASIRRQVHSRVLDAIEDDRYIVILEAFDFQKIWKQKVAVRLWETRFSLSQRHDDFRADLPRMAQAAEYFFGTNNPRISYEGIPEGQVEIGPLKSLGVLK